jgi:hypothetical protein
MPTTVNLVLTINDDNFDTRKILSKMEALKAHLEGISLEKENPGFTFMITSLNSEEVTEEESDDIRDSDLTDSEPSFVGVMRSLVDNAAVKEFPSGDLLKSIILLYPEEKEFIEKVCSKGTLTLLGMNPGQMDLTDIQYEIVEAIIGIETSILINWIKFAILNFDYVKILAWLKTGHIYLLELCEWLEDACSRYDYATGIYLPSLVDLALKDILSLYDMDFDWELQRPEEEKSVNVDWNLLEEAFKPSKPSLTIVK